VRETSYSTGQGIWELGVGRKLPSMSELYTAGCFFFLQTRIPWIPLWFVRLFHFHWGYGDMVTLRKDAKMISTTALWNIGTVSGMIIARSCRMATLFRDCACPETRLVSWK
jgi:hypothetical protein